MRKSKICLIGVLEEKKEDRAEAIFEVILVENLPELKKNSNPQIQGVQWVDKKKPTPRHHGETTEHQNQKQLNMLEKK